MVKSLLILIAPSLGCSWMLAVIDCFSKMVWLFPIPAKEAHHVFEALITLFDRYGMVMLFLKVIVKEIQMDNGTEFKNKLMQLLQSYYGSKLSIY